MSQELIKSLIVWGPTILFLLVLGFYFLVGVLRGLRKSVILLIHATASMTICIIIFFSIVNSESIDQTMVGLINYILNMFGTSVQQIIGVSEELTSVKDIILELILSSMTEEEVFYYVIVDAGAYISALIELVYRMVLFIVLGIFHLFLVGLLNIIYHIFYPVRRKVRRQKKAFENGDASSPYKKRRLMGGVVGVCRGLISSVFALSFFGCLLFILTGGNDPLPERKEGTTEEISFGDDTYNAIYDYYSYVCEMSDTGIFKVLNSVKDSDDVPYYFYICDLMLQGKVYDENLGLDEKFYVRRETGAYIGFVKNAAALVLKYAGADTSSMIGSEGINVDATMNVLMNVLKDEEFVKEFSLLIDDFESKSFVISLSLSALTSFVNHIDLVLGADSKVTKLVQKVFNPETGIKVTDLATEQDIKNLFKAVINITSTALNDMEVEAKARQSLNAPIDLANFDIKLAFKYGALLIDQIQSLSLFNDRKDIGNKLFKNIYEFCAEELMEDKTGLPEIQQASWVDEFNILFDSVEPILSIAAEVYTADSNELIANVFNLFNGENGEQMEKEFDKLVSQLSKSNLLDIVFRSTVPGSAIDSMLQQMTSNADASMPKDFTLASTAEEPGELEILLTVVKDFIKHDGVTIYDAMKDSTIDENDLREIFKVLNKDLNESEEVEEKLIDKLLASKALRYFLSSFVTYMSLGDIKLYITDSAAEKIEEVITTVDENGKESLVTKSYNIIKKDELSTLFDFIFSSPDFIIDLLGGEEIDYVEVLTSDEIVDLMKKSNLLKGIIAGVFISVTDDVEIIILPKGFDDPEKWITEKEIDNLVDAIINLKEEKTESGDSLLSTLLGGSIEIDTILDLSDNVINELYRSKVLKYTISNVLTTFADGEFSIVIPAVVCEEKNALTTVSGKTVNVVSSTELINIFNQIKNIINVDDSNIEVLYSKIFNNKAEILESYTIQATIMNMLINMSTGEDSFISVPEAFVSEYNEFIKVETLEDLQDNKWFVSEHIVLAPDDSKVKDDELYLLFDAIEELLGDEHKTTDEEGNEIVKDDFNLDNIGDSIKIKKTSIDTITSSYVLNGTLTDTISSNFATPLSALENGVIIKSELESLLDSLFVILNKHDEDSSITLEDFENIDINTIRIAKSDFVKENEDDFSHLDSSVFMTAFSSMITDVENVFVPVDATIEVDVLENKEYKRINRIVDETINGKPDDNEFNYLLECLFEFLGKTDETTGDVVINLEEFENVEDFKITEHRVPIIKASRVFSASMSVILCEDDILVVPEKNDMDEICTALVDMVNQEYDKYILTQEELANTLLSLIELFGEENIETNEKELGLEIDLNNFVINDVVIEKIINSAVISATISDYIVDKNIGVVPNMSNVTETITIVEKGVIANSFRIVQNELNSFMNTALTLFGKENNETNELELNINDIDLSNFEISNDNVDYLDDSIIINATTTKELAKIDALVIPVYSNGEEIADIHSVVNSNTSCAIIKEIAEFMKEMIEIFGGAINPSNLSTFELTLTENENLEGILWATFAKQLIDNNSILIPYSDGETVSSVSTLEFDDTSGIYTKDTNLVSYEETNSFKDSLIRVLSETNVLKINLNDGINTEKMEFGPEDISSDDGIFASGIFTATVAKTILELDTLKVPSIVKIDEAFYGKFETIKTLRVDQVKSLFNSLFVSINNQKIKINDFNTNTMVLPTNRDKICEMLDSLIVAATMSNEIVSKSNDSIVILQKVMENYGYDVDLDGTKDFDSELYISIDELTNLIQALTVGLNKTVISDLTFEHIEIPTDENVDIIISSELLRATITREIMAQEQGLSVDKNICDVETIYNTETNVMVINQSELKLTIVGLNELGFKTTFDNITIGVEELAQDTTALTAVAQSSVLRSILTNSLMEERTILGVTQPYYKFINMDDPEYVDTYKEFMFKSIESAPIFSKTQVLSLPTLIGG